MLSIAVRGPGRGERRAGRVGPLFRLSGTHVKINRRVRKHARRAADDHETKAFADVSFTTGGVWTSLGPKMVWKADAAGKLPRSSGTTTSLRVSFVFGRIWASLTFTLAVNLAVAMGMLGVAVTVVDAASEYLVSNFDDQKYDDRNDFMTLEALKEYALRAAIRRSTSYAASPVTSRPAESITRHEPTAPACPEQHGERSRRPRPGGSAR